jgi:hypothetical protein
MNTPYFVPFPKIPRLDRRMVITEKIDGTNGLIAIDEDGGVMCGSRNRWLDYGSDNFGFHAWVRKHEEELRELGPGYHYGEWWGSGIQRGYGLKEKRFSLFNTNRWHAATEEPREIPKLDGTVRLTEAAPACVGVVPILYDGEFDIGDIDFTMRLLAESGSVASPGFGDPEGVIVWHEGGSLFKRTFKDNGGKWKSLM